MESSFKNKKILIMGLGLHGGGVGVAKFFCKQKAKVLVTDLKTKKQLKESINKLNGLPIEYVLGKHREEDFLSADLIIKNPDVPLSSPYLKIAKQNNIEIETDVNLFFKFSKVFIIGVTGTKGKSTTVSLIYHLLKPKYKRLFLAGNIGVSPLELLPKVKKGDIVVLELSSFELDDLNQSPNIAVITNIFKDHLNRYSGMSEYIESKKRIFKFQSKKDVLILNEDDFIVRQFENQASGKVFFFSPKTVNLNGLNLFGEHNRANVSSAIKVAKLMKVSESSIKKSLATFNGVANRQEFVKEIKKVKYYNDTTATMPDATIVAIKSFSEKFPHAKLIFIMGGQDKELDYSQLIKEIKTKVGELVLLPGTASDKIKKGLINYFNLHEVFSMKEAVKKAKKLAKPGEIVVLSPAAASFNLFKNEFDRGDQFVKFVKSIR
jgi:UDP-N-acetylmuramoylalanine--D-glutamate ligase